MWLTLEQIQDALMKGLRVQQSEKHPGCCWYPIWKDIAINTNRFDYRVDPWYTEWFPPDVHPVHVGVYERESTIKSGYLSNPTHFSKWNGVDWLLSSDDKEEASQETNRFSGEQFTTWRGLQYQT